MNSSHLSERGTQESSAPLRVLTHSMSLDPCGGIEWSTMQDAVELSRRGNDVRVAFGDDGSLRSGFQDAGVDLWGPVSFTVSPGHLLHTTASFARSARWARASHADILWLQRFEQIAWGETVAVSARIPIVCHLHDVLNPPAISLVSRGVSHFIAVSEFIRDAWIERGIRGDRISVVPNAVPLTAYPVGGADERAAARSALELPADAQVVLYYGRVIRSKGIATLLEAWADVEASGSGACLVIVGSPPPNSDPLLGPLFRRLDADRTRWFPTQSNIVPFLHASDLVVLPALKPEPFGRVIIEAMATGRPVIASRVGAIPEILAGPMERFLVEPGNPTELATRLMSVLNWRIDEPELMKSCEEWVRTRFLFERHIDQIEEVLRRFRR